MKKTTFNLSVFFSALFALIMINFFGVKFSSIYMVLIGGTLGLIVYLVTFAVNKFKPNNDLNEKTKNKEKINELCILQNRQR